MIELNVRYFRLIQRLEKENCRKYKVYDIDDHYYITIDTLLDVLDDTEDKRIYAEERIEELSNELKVRPEEANSLQLTTMIEVKKLKEENEELKTTIEAIQNTLDEDDYDRLREEGITYYEEHDS